MLTPREESAFRMSRFIMQIMPELLKLKPWLAKDPNSEEGFQNILNDLRHIVDHLLTDDFGIFAIAGKIRSNWHKVEPKVLREKMKQLWSADESVGKLINCIYGGTQKLI